MTGVLEEEKGVHRHGVKRQICSFTILNNLLFGPSTIAPRERRVSRRSCTLERKAIRLEQQRACLYAHFHKVFAPRDWEQIACFEKHFCNLRLAHFPSIEFPRDRAESTRVSSPFTWLACIKLGINLGFLSQKTTYK